MGLISIIMPAYNAGKYIAESIRSVQQQTVSNWELIIVDDESTDNTSEIVQALASTDTRIKYFWQKNGKQGRARNRGLKETSGEFIAFLDADDVWLPHKLEVQLNDLTKQGVDLIFGHAYLIKETVPTTDRTGRGQGKYEGDESVNFLLYHDAFVMSTVFTRKTVLDKVGGFETDDSIQYCEDWHMWLNIALSGFSFFSSGEPVSYYRVHPESAAKVEKHAQIKFFLALVNLCSRYPRHVALHKETKRRGYNLVFHNPLTENVITTILKVNYPGYRYFFFGLWLKLVSKLSVRLFRKLFLKINLPVDLQQR